MTMNAMPLSSGRFLSSCRITLNPPAEAPMAAMGKVPRSDWPLLSLAAEVDFFSRSCTSWEFSSLLCWFWLSSPESWFFLSADPGSVVVSLSLLITVCILWLVAKELIFLYYQSVTTRYSLVKMDPSSIFQGLGVCRTIREPVSAWKILPDQGGYRLDGCRLARCRVFYKNHQPNRRTYLCDV